MATAPKRPSELPLLAHAAGTPTGRTHRLLDRAAKVFQSGGGLKARKQRCTVWPLLWHEIEKTHVPYQLYGQDKFHSLINLSTSKVMVLVLSLYFISFLFYAVVFYLLRGHCNADWKTFTAAYQFSVQTLMTVGLGASDPFFSSCPSFATLISTEAVLGSVLDALCIGIVYDRVSRPHPRACTVLFSRYATLAPTATAGGPWQLRWRAVDIRKHQLVEAHARMHVVKHSFAADGSIDEYFTTAYMRTHVPDDEVGAMVLLTLPQNITHFLDADSPLLPTPEYLASHAGSATPATEVVAVVGDKDVSLDVLLRYWEDAELEILALVEGIDSATSDTIQARHSFVRSDVRVRTRFARCVGRHPSGRPVVDYDEFHRVVPIV